MPLDESRYLRLASLAFRAIEDALSDVDPDDVDVDTSGDVLTLSLKDGTKCIVNTQRPTRQIWLAARARAWHFSYDEAKNAWFDDKGRGDELFTTIASIVRVGSGLNLSFAQPPRS